MHNYTDNPAKSYKSKQRHAVEADTETKRPVESQHRAVRDREQRIFILRFAKAVEDVFRSIIPVRDYSKFYDFERGRFAAYVRLADRFREALAASEKIRPTGFDADSFLNDIGLSDMRDFSTEQDGGVIFVDDDEESADLDQAKASIKAALDMADHWSENVTHALSPEKVRALFRRISIHLESAKSSLEQ